MNRKVIILPFDGYPTAAKLHEAISDLPLDVWDMVAYIKINDGAHNIDQGGPAIMNYIRHNVPDSVGIFLDLKIYDVSATMVNVLKKYSIAPDILTVSSQCSVEGIIKLRKLLPEKTKLAMVSLLTDIGEDECSKRFCMKPDEKIIDDLSGIETIYYDKKISDPSLPEHLFDLIVCSPKEVEYLKNNLPNHYGFIVPGIRDKWMRSSTEHQKRTTGVAEALKSGATYVVMGAQITKGNPEKDISPEESRNLTFDEIRDI